MAEFLANNLGTILTGLVLAAIVAAIIIKLVADKKKGKPLGCNCGCARCPKAVSCEAARREENK